MLSSYALAIQRQESFSGNLFQQKTKAKCASKRGLDYAATVFHYIHQNAYRAGLVNKMEDWEFSSYRDFAGLAVPELHRLCSKQLAFQLLHLNPQLIIEDSFEVLSRK